MLSCQKDEKVYRLSTLCMLNMKIGQHLVSVAQIKDWKLKTLKETFNCLRNSLTVVLMPNILPTLANKTIGKEIGDHYPIFYNISAQSAETRYGTQSGTDYPMLPSLIDPLFSFLTICGWKQEDIFLQIILVFCVYGQTGIVQIRAEFVHSGHYNQHKVKVP